MSSIFSTDELGNTHSEDSTLFSNSLDLASSTAYGLDLGNNFGLYSTSLASNSSSDEIAADLESAYWHQSDPLITDFLQAAQTFDNSHRSNSVNADELTGLGQEDELLYATTAVETISGELSLTDEPNLTRPNAFKDDYSLSTQQTENVQINLESSVFDTYLQLIDANTGSLIDSNDDISAGENNSQISFTAEAGRQYLIRATSYVAAAVGGYSLTAHIGSSNEPSPLPNTSTSFSNLYGYGLIDAASAVATAVGQSRFGNVADIGGNQWNNDMIYAPEAWAQGYTGEGVTVAVIDSGVDFTHSDLSNSMWVNTDEILGDGIDNDNNNYIDDRFGWNFGSDQNNNNILPDAQRIANYHGTHVAGTIAAANNGIGMTGVAYNANIMAIRIGDPSGEDNIFRNGGDLSEAIRYAVDNGANVINMSLGGGSDPDGRIRAALDYAASRNVIAVMAAGNSNSGNQYSPIMPAGYATDYGISVGAVSSNGNIADFSHQAGTDSRMRHVMAPGQEIYSTMLDNSWGFLNGTSMAAPHVAGVVALMLSANPNLTHDQVREILTGTATFSAASTAASNNSVLASSASSSEQGILAEPVASLYEAESSVKTSFQLANVEAAEMSEFMPELISENSQMLNSSHSDDWQFQVPQPLFNELLAPMMT